MRRQPDHLRRARSRLYYGISVPNASAAAEAPGVEAVEKVPERILGRDAEKSDLIECAAIDDLMLGKIQVAPENTVLTRQKDFFYKLVKRLKNNQ